MSRMKRTGRFPLRETARTAVMAAIVCVLTLLSLPVPGGGNINAGDAAILAGAFLLPLPGGMCAALIGATLSDLIGGYAVYLPATALIKPTVVFIAFLLSRFLRRGTLRFPVLSELLAGVVAELWMAAGYLLYEAFALGYGYAALLSFPWNLLQGAVAVLFGTVLTRLLSGKRKMGK